MEKYYFVKTPKITKVDNNKWQLDSELSYHLFYSSTNSENYIVPAGFISNGTTAPKWVKRFVNLDTLKYLPAVALHDYMIEKDSHKYTRKFIDYIFYQALLDRGMTKWKAQLVHRAVQAYGIATKGKSYWKK